MDAEAFLIDALVFQISAEDRAVLVTGCDTGFGHHLAVKLHSLGFVVFAACLNENCDGAVRLKNLGLETGRIHVIAMDVTNQKQVDEAYRYVHDHLPQLGLWGIVNNAGLGCVGFIEWIPLEMFEKVFSSKYPRKEWNITDCS